MPDLIRHLFLCWKSLVDSPPTPPNVESILKQVQHKVESMIKIANLHKNLRRNRYKGKLMDWLLFFIGDKDQGKEMYKKKFLYTINEDYIRK